MRRAISEHPRYLAFLEPLPLMIVRKLEAILWFDTHGYNGDSWIEQGTSCNGQITTFQICRDEINLDHRVFAI